MRMLTIHRQLLPDTVNTRNDSLTAQFTLTSSVTRVTSVASARNQITMPLTVQNLTTAIDFDLLGEIAECDSLCNLCDRPDLGCKIRSKAVDNCQ